MVSLKTIAEKCGVSTATVSKALNDQKDISEETKSRIRTVAEQLGYFPNAAARSLKTNHSYNLGVLFEEEAGSGLQHEYFSGVLNGLGEQLFIFEVNTISSLINLISIYFLVPIYGLNGFIFIWFITSIVVTTITLLRIKERTKTHFSVTLLFVKPILSITCACVIMLFISNHFFQTTSNITILTSLTIASVIYILLLFILKCLRKEDLTRF